MKTVEKSQKGLPAEEAINEFKQISTNAPKRKTSFIRLTFIRLFNKRDPDTKNAYNNIFTWSQKKLEKFSSPSLTLS